MISRSFKNWLDGRVDSPHAPADAGERNGTQAVGSGLSLPDGVFAKCEGCKKPTYGKELAARFNVCPNCGFHHPLPAPERIRLLTDASSFEECDAGAVAVDPLGFKGYAEKLEKASKKTNLIDAIVSGVGNIGGHRTAIAAMDFRFIGGSMGSVVGERIARTIENAHEEELPLVIVSASGGARMFEGIYSLMQMAKTSVVLSRYMSGSKPYISVLTDPTFGGVTASFATAADVVIAEPGARIGFAGARVLQQTTKERLPEGFQTAEFQKERGMVDSIVHRLALRSDLKRLLGFLA